ncbi:CinA family protein [Mesomycoplasma molare]|uniref:Nicotinamide-nucleotide amidohydrolase family protein n=1 Tax=Mesomycoplasma molare TaxID=171288 RepID=A0ABY5TYJ7_9BACT|nr:CinA family protein [Mesomycoplasma molare]UWD34283.1 nicotinamide-nucleotide amidohydrolase family protein [Mesomycoplasma molare]
MKNKTFASIESFTGGAFSYKIVSQPGASKYFKGSIVTYWNEIKEKIGVNTSNGVISAETALEMAKRGREFFDVDYCFAFTGNAGPIPMEKNDIGETYIAINEEVFRLELKGNREEIISQAVEFAYKKFKALNE